jgi:hypothetical protein
MTHKLIRTERIDPQWMAGTNLEKKEPADAGSKEERTVHVWHGTSHPE